MENKEQTVCKGTYACRKKGIFLSFCSVEIEWTDGCLTMISSLLFKRLSFKNRMRMLWQAANDTNWQKTSDLLKKRNFRLITSQYVDADSYRYTHRSSESLSSILSSTLVVYELLKLTRANDIALFRVPNANQIQSKMDFRLLSFFINYRQRETKNHTYHSLISFRLIEFN